GAVERQSRKPLIISIERAITRRSTGRRLGPLAKVAVAAAGEGKCDAPQIKFSAWNRTCGPPRPWGHTAVVAVAGAFRGRDGDLLLEVRQCLRLVRRL